MSFRQSEEPNHDIHFWNQALLQNCEMPPFASSCLSIYLSVCLPARPPARPYGTPQLPLDGISWNLIFECFSKRSKKFRFY